MPYRFAIVGCGRIALRHAQHIMNRGMLQAVCDIIPLKAREFSENYKVRAYTQLKDLLNNEPVDVVSVCTPNGLHTDQTIQSLESGCHVLCEKPMTISVEEGRRMVAAAERTGKKLFVVKQNRFNPPVEILRKLLEKQQLGNITSFQINCFWNRPPEYYLNSWRGTKEMDGGTLFTQFSHFIDLLYWLLGDLKAAKGIRSNFFHKKIIEFEDTGAALLQMESGAIGTINYTVNSHKRNMEGSFTVFGEKGTVKIGGQYLNELEFFSVNGLEKPTLAESGPPNQYGLYEGSMSNHDKVYENLIVALDNPQHKFVDAKEALKTVEIIERIYAVSPFSDSTGQ